MFSEHWSLKLYKPLSVLYTRRLYKAFSLNPIPVQRSTRTVLRESTRRCSIITPASMVESGPVEGATDDRPGVMQLKPPLRLDLHWPGDAEKVPSCAAVVAAHAEVAVLRSRRSHPSLTVVSSPEASPVFWFHHLCVVVGTGEVVPELAVLDPMAVQGTAAVCDVPLRLPGSLTELQAEIDAEQSALCDHLCASLGQRHKYRPSSSCPRSVPFALSTPTLQRMTPPTHTQTTIKICNKTKQPRLLYYHEFCSIRTGLANNMYKTKEQQKLFIQLEKNKQKCLKLFLVSY